MKINICILYGGKTTEHEISIITALEALENFNKDKYNILPVYISKENDFYTGSELLDINNYKDIEILLTKLKKVNFIKENNNLYVKVKNKFYNRKIFKVDCLFPIVHGTNTEDGTIAGYLSMFNVPYVLSDVCSSAVSMDKYFTKCILNYNNIDVLPGLTFNIHDDIDIVIKQIEDKLSYPVIVKPNNLGSSIGIKSASNIDELKDAIYYSFEFSKDIIVEEKLNEFREINCSVLGDSENMITSSLEEVIKSDEILSFNDKYLNNLKTKNIDLLNRIIPASISKELEDKINDISIKTFKILKSNGVIRIDYLYDQNKDKLYVNEVNNIPGSLASYLWKESGKNFTTLLDELIKLAFKRYREDEKINYVFLSNVLNKTNKIKK
jgi:D-alanine-D-alanine ligase